MPRVRQKKRWIRSELRYQVLSLYDYACQSCGRQAPDAVLHVEHIVPRSARGDDSIGNLSLACADCSASKGAFISTNPETIPAASHNRIVNAMREETKRMEVKIAALQKRIEEQHRRATMLKEPLPSKMAPTGVRTASGETMESCNRRLRRDLADARDSISSLEEQIRSMRRERREKK